MLGLTLLNSSTSPDPYPERGIHQFVIGLTACADRPAAAENKATAFCHGVQYQSNSIHPGTLPAEKQLVTLESETAVLSAVWMEGTEMRVRLYETGGKASRGVFHLEDKVADAQICDGLGDPLEGKAEVNGSTVRFTSQPYQLMEIHITFA